MDDKITKARKEAENNLGKLVDLGDGVWCDICSEDYTNSDRRGGFLFGSKGICPNCSIRMRASIKKYNEEHYIKAEASEGESFKDFIIRIRGGNNTVTICSL